MSDLLASLKALIQCARQLKQAQAAQVGRPSELTAEQFRPYREQSDKAVAEFWAAMEQAKAALAECGGNPFVTQWIEELADHSPKAGSMLGAVAMSNTWARSLDELREIVQELERLPEKPDGITRRTWDIYKLDLKLSADDPTSTDKDTVLAWNRLHSADPIDIRAVQNARRNSIKSLAARAAANA